MFERFTKRARGTVAAARQEAGELGHGFVGTEHLLLGLLVHEPQAGPNPVRELLESVGIHHAYVRSELARRVGYPDLLGTDAASALGTIGIDLDSVRQAVEGTFGEGALDKPAADPGGGRRPFTRRAKRVLELALREAQELHDGFLGREHLLLGLIREGNGLAAEILAMRVELADLRERLLARIGKVA